ncbi:CRISPR-associated endonuclease Cas3'' [Actinosynnema sp. CS-041913]|uniref:CRISPR-associated endonuclease Cas3'' n=1 Tax=Actinosynnema sp. CS-041913 TaxID=3239917 RepID=UPI003D8D373D
MATCRLATPRQRQPCGAGEDRDNVGRHRSGCCPASPWFVAPFGCSCGWCGVWVVCFVGARLYGRVVRRGTAAWKVFVEVWAHSPSRATGSWHPLVDHVCSTAELARGFADSFGAGALAAALGLVHDAGKAGCSWQAKLRQVAVSGDRVGIPHKELGALMLRDRALAAAMAVQGASRWPRPSAGPGRFGVDAGVAGDAGPVPRRGPGGAGGCRRARRCCRSRGRSRVWWGSWAFGWCSRPWSTPTTWTPPPTTTGGCVPGCCRRRT